MKVKVNIENCERYIDKFATELAVRLDWQFEKSVSDSDVCLSLLGYTSIYTLCTNYSLIHEAEKQVIEKVGELEYGIKLVNLVGDLPKMITVEVALKCATASAQQRLTAMLLALGIEELEVGE